MRLRSLGVLLFVLLLALPAVAQEQSGSIQGVVTDSNGEPVAGARVRACPSLWPRAQSPT